LLYKTKIVSTRNFHHLIFRLLFTRLGLLLLAIELKDEEKKECNIAINPGSNTIIQPQTQGFFIAQSADEVKR
jgi:potassium large conductance calcium-activated channel subfamily M alpha protein 1